MITYPPKLKMETPWGVADSIREIIPGIWKIGTPSHGGILLDSLRLEKLPKAFSGWEWFEEDEAWSIPYCIFAKELNPEDVYHAVKTISRSYPKTPEEYITEARKIAARWEEANKNRYLHGGFSFFGSSGTEIQSFDPIDKSKQRISAKRTRKNWADSFEFPHLPTLEDLLKIPDVEISYN